MVTPAVKREAVAYLKNAHEMALEEWRRDYNTVRPHSGIGWLTPADYAATFSPQPGQGAARHDGSAPWRVAPITADLNRQTLAAPG